MPGNDARAILNNSLFWIKGQRLVINFLGNLVGPVGFTTVLLYYDPLTKAGFFWPAASFVLFVWALGIIFSSVGIQTPVEAQQKIHDYENDILSLREENNFLSESVKTNNFRVQLARSWTDLISAYNFDNMVDENELKLGIHSILSPFVRSPENIFGYGKNAYWTATVYLYREQDHSLYAIERETSQQENPEDLGRIWPYGEGQVGFAFMQDRLVIVGDQPNDPKAALIHTPPALQKPGDEKLYPCMAAMPLRPPSGTGERLGCLIVTSSEPDSLSDETDKDILETAAACVCTLIKLHRRPPEEIIRRNRGELLNG
jgi:hypothetical protein